MNKQSLRFNKAPWFDKEFIHRNNITVIGVGNIGSWLCLYLSRIGYQINAVDPDILEEHNIGGQLFSSNFIGEQKAVALHALLRFLNTENVKMTTFDKNIQITDYDLIHNHSDIVIVCTDNMLARKYAFEQFISSKNAYLFIDGRSLAEQFEIYTVNKNNSEEIDKYAKTLFLDEEVEDAVCNYKSTSHCGSMCASLMINSLNIRVANILLKDNIYPEYFSQKINLAFMNFQFE